MTMKTLPLFCLCATLLLPLTRASSEEAAANLPGEQEGPTIGEVRVGLENFLGGNEAWEEIHSLRLDGTLQSGNAKPSPMQIFRKRPNKLRAIVDRPDGPGSVMLGYDGSSPWMQVEAPNAQGKLEKRLLPLSEGVASRLKSEAQFGWPVHLVLDPTTRVSLLPPQGEGSLLRLRIERPDGWFAILWLDPKTFEPRQVEYPDASGGEDAKMLRAVLDDWGEVNGIRFPYLVTIHLADGKKSIITAREHRANIGLFDSYFQKPDPEK